MFVGVLSFAKQFIFFFLVFVLFSLVLVFLNIEENKKSVHFQISMANKERRQKLNRFLNSTLIM